MTYDKFQEVFAKKKPQVSLLFATDAGYFSYCVIAPHLLEEGIGVSIRADNAMAEIERYLIKRERTPRSKILVVDDSVMIREEMKHLLSKDYDVTLARCFRILYLPQTHEFFRVFAGLQAIFYIKLRENTIRNFSKNFSKK